MKHFYIITNHIKDPELETTKWIETYLKERGVDCIVHVQEDCQGRYYTDSRLIPPETDCIVVLGGDGTLLEAARDTAQLDIPLIGVNLGTLGYLAEVEKTNLTEALEQLCKDAYEIDRRMMLNGSVIQSQGDVLENEALNDVVISRNGPLQVIHFRIYVNGHFLKKYSADGIIVSTPTGSTGYNLSAGGPIVEPNASLIVITPICPHTLNTRSIVLSPEDCIEIEIGPAGSGRVQEVEANFDGSHSIPMKTGERIVIKRSQRTTSIIRLSDVSFLEALHKKMGE